MSLPLTLIPVLVDPFQVYGVHLDDPVGEIKSYIREQCGTVGSESVFLYDGTNELNDDTKTLSSHGVCGGVIYAFLYSMQLVVKPLATGRDITVCVDPNALTWVIKRQLEVLEDMPPPEHQRLIWSGKQLNDAKTPLEYGIPPGASLHEVNSLRGGGPGGIFCGTLHAIGIGIATVPWDGKMKVTDVLWCNCNGVNCFLILILMQHKNIRGVSMKLNDAMVIVSEVSGYDWYIGAQALGKQGEIFSGFGLGLFPKAYVQVNHLLDKLDNEPKALQHRRWTDPKDVPSTLDFKFAGLPDDGVFHGYNVRKLVNDSTDQASCSSSELPIFLYPLASSMEYSTPNNPFERIHLQLNYQYLDTPNSSTEVVVKLEIMKLHEIRTLSLRIVASGNKVIRASPIEWFGEGVESSVTQNLEGTVSSKASVTIGPFGRVPLSLSLERTNEGTDKLMESGTRTLAASIRGGWFGDMAWWDFHQESTLSNATLQSYESLQFTLRDKPCEFEYFVEITKKNGTKTRFGSQSIGTRVANWIVKGIKGRT